MTTPPPIPDKAELLAAWESIDRPEIPIRQGTDVHHLPRFLDYIEAHGFTEELESVRVFLAPHRSEKN